MNLFEKCERYYERVQDEIERIGAYPYFTPIEAVTRNRVIVDGKEMIMVGSNNYLGLWDHPEVKKASQEAIDRFGVSTCGSRFLNGTLSLHIELEKRLAEFMRKEACQCFSTGFQTNLGAISSLVGKDDVIIVDRAVHASIIDAARLSFGELVKFKHNDLDDLKRILSEIPKDKGKLIVVDGVFSMEGDLSDLPKITEMAKKYDAMLMVDDAHGLGVLGENGRGTAEHFNLLDEVDLIMGTFSKSFASLGGFIVGKKEVISYIKHNARSLIFSASMTPASAASALTALKIIKREPERRKRLWEITHRVKNELNSMGFNTGFTQTPIIPIILKEDEKAFTLWKVLKEMGIFTNPIISPAVPPGRALIRTSYTATHTDEEISIVLDSIYRAGKMLGFI
ncbi:MAG: aminotransferase class I/II-fold pyridoxal phosphate-dependent enzyme [Candidatus Aminicenantia bacterium]